MPIYAYRCDACGHAKDVLQKVSDPLLTRCPACGAEAFQKQVTSAGFQLKGSGWYVTDFRGDNSKKPADGDKAEAAKREGAEAEPAKGEVKKADAAKGDAAKGDTKAPEAGGAKAAEAPAPAPAPAGGKSVDKASAPATGTGTGSGGAAPGQ